MKFAKNETCLSQLLLVVNMLVFFTVGKKLGYAYLLLPLDLFRIVDSGLFDSDLEVHCFSFSCW